MRRFLTYAATAVGLTMLVSFIGAMFDPARAAIWTQTLMWSAIASVIIAPFFAFAGRSIRPMNDPNRELQRTSKAAQAFLEDEPFSAQKETETEEEPFDTGSHTLWPQNTSEAESKKTVNA